MKVYYPQTALEGFAQAIASKLGVTIRVGVGQPRTDGTTVYLPAISGAIDADGFGVLCGVAIHEAAHVFYGTPAIMDAFAGNGPDAKLRALAYNAVADIADETRVGRAIASAPALLFRMNLKYEADAVASPLWKTGDPIRQILCAAICFHRCGNSTAYKTLKGAKHPLFPVFMHAYRILKGARDMRGSAGPRTLAQRQRLASVAQELADLLKQHGDGSGCPDPRDAGKQPGPATGNGQPIPATIDGAAALAAARSKEPIDIADRAQGEAVADNKAGAPDQADGTPVTVIMPGKGAGTSQGAQQQEPCRMDMALYQALRPSLIGPIERLARHDDADGLEDGHYSGPTIGRNIERALIDGACFVRRNAEGEKLHATVLLDNSGSMHGQLPEVSAIAQAFAEALAGATQTLALATFSEGAVPQKSYRNIGSVGGTDTDAGLRWAQRQLADKHGRRVCIVITDGAANSPDRACQETQKLRSAGVAVIGIAYQCGVREITRSMQGAQIIGADSPVMLACQLARVAAQVAR